MIMLLVLYQREKVDLRRLKQVSNLQYFVTLKLRGPYISPGNVRIVKSMGRVGASGEDRETIHACRILVEMLFRIHDT
jgi:hypothetical protein